jgi:predicted DCC family thiol-disulfide oxidoreductase YuxK
MEIGELPKDKKIILFDGVCNLCDAVVRQIVKRDKRDVFRFVALQSELGQKIVRHIGVDPAKTDSIILYEPGKAYFYKADAALEVAKTLGGTAGLALGLKIFPGWLRNKIYDYVAKNRYKWYGRKDACMIPTPELKAKFLE